MKHICTDGEGKKIEIELTDLLHTSDVAQENGVFKFLITYQVNAKRVEIGGFMNRSDASSEKQRLDEAKQEEVNKL